MDCVQDGSRRKCWRFISQPPHSKHTLCKYNRKHHFLSFLSLSTYLSSKVGENFPRARNQEGNQSHSSETEAHRNAGVPKIGVLMTTWEQRSSLQFQEEQQAETKPPAQSWELRKDCLSWTQKTEVEKNPSTHLSIQLGKSHQNSQSHWSLGLDSDQTSSVKACSE